MRKAVCMACCAALMLCGCGGGSDPDIAKVHKDFLEYTFGGNYSIKKNAEKCNEEQNVWEITFTDKKGSEKTKEITLDIESDEDFAKYECNWQMLNFVEGQIGLAVNDELYEQLIKPNFDCVQSGEDPFKYEGDGFTLTVIAECYDLFDPSDEILEADLDSKSGVSYVDTELKSWAQMKTNGMQIYITLEDAADVDAVSQKLLKFGGDYCEYTVSPQNYCFSLHAPDDSGELQMVASGCKVLGEDEDASAYSVSYILKRLGRMSDNTAATDGEDIM